MKATVAVFLYLVLMAEAGPASPSAQLARADQRFAIKVTAKGFEPATVNVKAGQPVVLVVTRTTDKTCAKELVIADRRIRQALPLGRAVEARLTPRKSGKVRFACSMDMIAGTIVVE